MQKQQQIYTRNPISIEIGTKLPQILIYNQKEEEIDLCTLKKNKIYITVPSLTNQSIMSEVSKLDIIFEDFKDFDFYLISNESVLTQSRLLQSRKFKSFQLLSDFKHRDFARYTGTYIYEISALVKSIFLVDESNHVIYVQYYDDLYSNFDAVEIVKQLESLR